MNKDQTGIWFWIGLVVMVFLIVIFTLLGLFIGWKVGGILSAMAGLFYGGFLIFPLFDVIISNDKKITFMDRIVLVTMAPITIVLGCSAGFFLGRMIGSAIDGANGQFYGGSIGFTVGPIILWSISIWWLNF